MLDSVCKMITADAARVYKTLFGTLPAGLGSTIVAQDHFFDLESGRGELLQRVLGAIEARDGSAIAESVCLLACPFHLSEALFHSPWHSDFDFRLECLRRDLPFVYDPDERFQEISEKALLVWLRRSMHEEIERVIEAYKYGNGFPVLREGFIQSWYDRAANWTLSAWIFIGTQSPEVSPVVQSSPVSSSLSEPT